MSAAEKDAVAGRNGVVIVKKPLRAADGSGYRTYEVHQRERVGESTEKIKPAQLISEEYRTNPYPLLEILRENYPCYRDWLNNSYWITQYNDVTSILADDANFETRSNAWFYGLDDLGRDLGNELSVLNAEETLMDSLAPVVAARLGEELAQSNSADLARQFCARFALEMLADRYAIPEDDRGEFSALFFNVVRGTNWEPIAQQAGLEAIEKLVAYFEPIVKERKASPGEDMVSAMLAVGDDVTAGDVVATLMEGDYQTLHGSLSNLWFLLLTNPDQFEKASDDRRLMKLAYLETLRHSPPIISAYRFSRHEVERFGKLLPEGARLVCSMAAANRDSRIFKDPDTFIVDRKDMCQREPRGQYRADGLATGIAYGLGKPSRFPAVPEDRPRSRYAIWRDTIVTASLELLNHVSDLKLANGAQPKLASLTVGEMHTCWQLPVTYKKK